MRHLDVYKELFSTSALGRLLIAFDGSFSQSNIISLGESIRNEIGERKNLKAARRAFNIYVEMSQNVRLYSLERNHNNQGRGQFLLFSNKDAFHLITCNLVEAGQMDSLKQKINEVNRLSPEELKSSYLVRQRQKTNKVKGCAGLGFLNMVRRSGYPLGIGFLAEGEGKLRFILRAIVQ